MNKYDFGYELTEDTTILWAYEKIEDGSTVLELGPSNGNLVFHLTRDKHCITDIVEIDADAGEQAARFCRNSCLGPIEGNLEENNWFIKLQDNSYDYIVALDVLEHIRNPRHVLELLHKLLKTDGVMLLSVPNVAHNSVVLNLMLNKFEYTSVGLLDDTHVHFYTYDSIKRLLNQAGYVTVREQVKQEKVGNNEIAVQYGCLPRNVEAYLKSRNLGTAYQFLFVAQKGQQQPYVNLEYNEDQMYEVVAFSAESGAILKSQKVNPLKKIHLSFSVNAENRRIRIDPLNANCIISDIDVVGFEKNGTSVPLAISEHTGSRFHDLYVFYDDDPQLYVEIGEEVTTIDFACSCACFDSEALSCMAEARDIIRIYETGIEEIKRLLASREAERDSAHLEMQKKDGLFAQKLKEKAEEIEALRLEKDTLCQEKNILQHEKSTLLLKNDTLNQERNLLEQETFVLKQQMHALQQQNEILQHDKVAYQKENAVLHQEKTVLQQDKNMQQQEIIILQQDKRQLEHDNNELQEHVKNVEAVNTQLNNELNEMNASIWGKAYHKIKKLKEVRGNEKS